MGWLDRMAFIVGVEKYGNAPVRIRGQSNARRSASTNQFTYPVASQYVVHIFSR